MHEKPKKQTFKQWNKDQSTALVTSKTLLTFSVYSLKMKFSMAPQPFKVVLQKNEKE